MLDFTLMTQEERVAYVNSHPEDIINTPNGLKTVADYILFPDPAFRESKTWYKKPAQSLDAIIEEAGDLPFNDHGAAITKVEPANMSTKRDQFKLRLSPSALKVFEDLWERIDTLDLQICYASKGEAPDRLKVFADAHPEINPSTCQYEPYTLLKKKRLLVELRREQYTIKDDTAPFITLQTHETGMPNLYVPFDICDISIGPISPDDYTARDFKRLLRPDRFPLPGDSFAPIRIRTNADFDFSNPEHVLGLVEHAEDLSEAVEQSTFDSNLPLFYYQWKTYLSLTEFTPITKRVFELKMQKYQNNQIVEILHDEFGTSYGANYISTLYRQKCIAKIAETAARHAMILTKLKESENFKTCNKCGITYYCDEAHFAHRSRSHDGFATVCKTCEKNRRNGIK